MKGSTLWIEHDGARGHNGKGYLDASDEAGKQDGWYIVFETQLAQSPDCDKNDLCFFNSLRRRAEESKMGNETSEMLLKAFMTADDDYPVNTSVSALKNHA